ncbi:extracellular solute-binding protein [Paenibacillus mesophilus]|uniref:extracellular solute-binding protein n=1 Tax=Paenibacillus mesophilus TaxID=2582849 RepID=UPI00110F5D35|nr:extracellular solute-binding protein [Paenibacillus mesophilus]TMV43510.1 extracellular solute-binding protein [Paenibacillus mesophilus]
MSETTDRKAFRVRLQTMIDEVRDRIRDGTYPKDSYLPSESALAKQFQLSNNSVRKGLAQLVEEGLIKKVDKVGSRVTGAKHYKKTTLNVVGYPMNNRDLDFTGIIEEFQALYPSIQITWNEHVPRETFALGQYLPSIVKYIRQATADLILLDHLQFRELIENGHADLLNEVEPAEETFSFLNEAFSVEGRMYVQPVIFSPVVLGYNREHFRQAGLQEPDSGWTWDDLVRAATRLTVPNERNGFYFYRISENRWPLLLLQSGMPFAGADEAEEKRNYAGTRLLDSIRLYGKLTGNNAFFPNYMAESPHDTSRLFLEGKISMTLLTYSSMNDLKHSDLDYDISAVPFIHYPVSLLTIMGIIVNKNSQNKEAAQLFADFIRSRETQESIRRRTLSLPAMKPAAIMPIRDDFNRPIHDSLFREIIPSYRTTSDLNMPVSKFKPLLNVLKLFWSDLIDETALCEQLKQL